MKALRVLTVVALAALVVACGSDPKANLAKAWQLAEMNIDGKPYKEAMEAEKAKQLAQFEQMGGEAAEIAKKSLEEGYAEAVTEMETSLKGSKVTLAKDGTYTAELLGEKDSGTWTLSDDAKTITLKGKDSREEPFKVLELTASRMVLEGSEDNHTYGLVFEAAK